MSPATDLNGIAWDVWFSFRKVWWNLLWGFQSFGRIAAGRFRKTTVVLMALRVVAHWAVGAWPVLLVKAVAWWLLGGRTALIITGVFGVVSFVVYALATNGERDMSAGASGSIARWLMAMRWVRGPVAWKLAFRTRGRWPGDWARPAAKTRAVQAEVGTAREARVTIRPVLDHPKISWLPKIEWPVVSWWVSPPPGRSFEEFDRMLPVLAANMINVVAIELDYERSTSSIGRMSVLFADPLADVGEPVWDTPVSDSPSNGVTEPVFDDSDGLAPVIPITSADPNRESA